GRLEVGRPLTARERKEPHVKNLIAAATELAREIDPAARVTGLRVLWSDRQPGPLGTTFEVLSPKLSPDHSQCLVVTLDALDIEAKPMTGAICPAADAPAL